MNKRQAQKNNPMIFKNMCAGLLVNVSLIKLKTIVPGIMVAKGKFIPNIDKTPGVKRINAGGTLNIK